METDEIIRRLQSRIDKYGYEISDAIAMNYWNDVDKERQKEIMASQALDKRVIGELINLRRQVKLYLES